MAQGELKFEITSVNEVKISSPRLYAVVRCGQAKKKVELQVGAQGGRAALKFHTKGEEEILVEVYDRHLLTGDELVGSLKVSLWKVITEQRQQLVEPLVGRRGAKVGVVVISLLFTYSSHPTAGAHAQPVATDRHGFPSSWGNETPAMQQGWSGAAQSAYGGPMQQQGGMTMGYPSVGWEGSGAPGQQALYPNMYSNGDQHAAQPAPNPGTDASGKPAKGAHGNGQFPAAPAGYPTSVPGNYQSGPGGMQVVYDNQPGVMHGGQQPYRPQRPQKPMRPGGGMGPGILTGVAAGVLGALTLDALF